MEIYIIVPTREVRTPVKNEYYYTDGEWYRLRSDNSCQSKYPIGIRHVLEVPDNLNYIHIYHANIRPWSKDNQPPACVISETYPDTRITIPIPHPKKKVKKWQWLCIDELGNYFLSVGKYKDIDELSNVFSNDTCSSECKVIRPIEETMEEVEE